MGGLQSRLFPSDRGDQKPKLGFRSTNQQGGQAMLAESNMEQSNREFPASPFRPQIAEVLGFQVPISDYYLHRGHSWVKLEITGQVRVGLDDFSQKILGPADGLKLPDVGKAYYQDHICMSLVRAGQRASVLAPVDVIIETINPKICQKPSLIHDDPYGEGWLFLAKPTNLQPNLGKLCSGEDNAAWIDQESHRLLSLMGPTVTLPDGGAIVDDVFGHYPQLDWKLLVREFYLPLITKGWKKR
jgi:glycine cleavage system H lipoate-binding protein